MQLADLFLSSGLIPAYTAASFAKKMARLAVDAPPAGAMMAIAFIHNLIRRHPACTVLLDNPAAASASASIKGVGEDVFDETQEDPAKSRAVESSLWELQCLRNHYCPQVWSHGPLKLVDNVYHPNLPLRKRTLFCCPYQSCPALQPSRSQPCVPSWIETCQIVAPPPRWMSTPWCQPRTHPCLRRR